jgi:predicted enzyme related to lactoylglutathione lyase
MTDATPAKFRWYELQTTDAAAAEAFYCAVVGWSAEHLGPQPDGYTTFNTEAGGVAGMMTLGAGEGAPRWIGYIAVDDVDASVGRITAAGGAVRQPPTDVPGMLRFSGVADPQGAAFVVFKGTSPDGPPSGDGPGYVGWHELWASDGAKAFDFYAGQFGWTKTNTFDMGPMGTYQLWTDGRDGGADAGGMMTSAPGGPGPVWNYYFRVESIEAAAARVSAAGGTVTNGPHPVPSGDWIVQGTDPQGAAFSLVSRNN